MLLRGLATQALFRELIEVALEALFLLVAELVQIAPRIETGRMHVVEDEADGVIADRIDLDDLDILLARHELALLGMMALHFRARALDPQVLGRQLETLAIVERYD